MRLRLDLSYDGSAFHGWARQPGLRTVQGDVETALDTVLRRPGAQLTVAGRTDTGVHARGQVAHLDLDEALLVAARGRSDLAATDALARRLDGVLEDDVRVHSVTLAPDGFDARFSALWRRYVYRISDGAVDPLTRGFVVGWPRRLDEVAMAEAASRLVGEHDFAAFCKKREGATTIRTLLELRVDRGATGVELTVRADAFCHSMVRALTGCLVAVGEGRRTPAWAGAVLAGRERDPGVTVMPAHGLTLEEVGYPADDALAAQAARARVVRTLGEDR